jgi:hypothetical protein
VTVESFVAVPVRNPNLHPSSTLPVDTPAKGIPTVESKKLMIPVRSATYVVSGAPESPPPILVPNDPTPPVTTTAEVSFGRLSRRRTRRPSPRTFFRAMCPFELEEAVQCTRTSAVCCPSPPDRAARHHPFTTRLFTPSTTLATKLHRPACAKGPKATRTPTNLNVVWLGEVLPL